MANSSSPFSFLWQALLLPSKNYKLIFTVFLIYIISQALLYIDFELSIAPLVSKINECEKLLDTIDRSSPEFTELVETIKTAAKQLIISEAVYYVFLFVISGFLSSVIICSAISATYVGEMMTLKELMNKVKGNVKGPLITILFVALFYFIFMIILFAIAFAISWCISVVFRTSSSFISTPLTLFAALSLSYLTVFWSMGLAISVIEPSFYGIDAISRAAKLLKGKKMQVFLLTVALSIGCGLMRVTNTMSILFFSDAKPGTLVLGIVLWFVQQVVTFYLAMAIMVLYYECNSNRSDEVAGNEEVQYTSLTTSLL